MTQQLALPLPYPQGWCNANRWNPGAWPQHITDQQGRQWLVLHVGGLDGKSQHARFCCHKPRTVEYHYVHDFEATPA